MRIINALSSSLIVGILGSLFWVNAMFGNLPFVLAGGIFAFVIAGLFFMLTTRSEGHYFACQEQLVAYYHEYRELEEAQNNWN